MVDSVLEVQNIKLPDSGGVTSSTAITLDASGVADFPNGATIAGHIIRTTYSTVYTTKVSTSGSEVASGLEITVNKTQSDSLIYLIFFATMQMDANATDGTAVLTIKNNTASTSIQAHRMRLATAYGGTTNIRIIDNRSAPLFAIDSASGTGNREYELYFSINYGTVSINGDAGYSQVLALEVLPNA